MQQDTILVTPDTPQQATLDKLNNVLTGIALKAGLLRTRREESPSCPDVKEIEDLATEAVSLVRQLGPN